MTHSEVAPLLATTEMSLFFHTQQKDWGWSNGTSPCPLRGTLLHSLHERKSIIGVTYWPPVEVMQNLMMPQQQVKSCRTNSILCRLSQTRRKGAVSLAIVMKIGLSMFILGYREKSLLFFPTVKIKLSASGVN